MTAPGATGRWAAEKRTVADAAKRLSDLGLVSGSSGNVSVRLPSDNPRGLLAVTPSGKRYSEMDEGDIVVADFDMEPVEGDLAPSSESLMHVAIYRSRPDVGAVIHTHSEFATVLAVAGLEAPPVIDEMAVALGGGIRVSEYAFPGSQELADSVCAALEGRKAAIIKNHGAVGVGRDLAEALDVSTLVERVSKIFVYASLLGRVDALPKEVVDAEAELFRMRLGVETKIGGHT